MDESNPYAPPESEVEYLPDQGDVWRKGKLLLMRKGAQLPGRCIHCNEKAALSKPRRILYLNIWIQIPLLILFVVFNFLALIPILIVMAVFRKSARIQIPLCEKHRKRRMIITLVTVAMLFLSVGLSVLAVRSNGYHEPYFVIGLVAFVLAFLLAFVRGQLLRAKKIDTDMLTLKGAKPPFLDSLAEYPK